MGTSEENGPSCDLPWLDSDHPFYNVTETLRHAVAAFEVGSIATSRRLILETKDRLDEMLPQTDFNEVQKALASGQGDGYFDKTC